MKTLFSLSLALVSVYAMAEENAVKRLESYKKLNNAEMRLMEYKDDDAMLKIKLNQLDVINKSRREFHLQEVKLDILASRVANKTSREAALNNYHGHYNLEGQKPYHRWAFAGGYDHVTENAAARWATKGSFEVNNDNKARYMKDLHERFMAEPPSHDGHKKTIIEPAHNYVGIGIYLTDKQCRYYEEFIDRYFTFDKVPTKVKPNESFTLDITADSTNYLYHMIVYYEPFNKPMTADKASSMGSYEDYTSKKELILTGWELSKLKKGKSKQYSIPMKFEKEGQYYVKIYAHDKEMKKPQEFTTKDKIQGSGIVIKVQ
ncbi:MAG TPA: CAP domain-containing protein [Flavobacteriales bacterium]|nr:CAP domain-containing protein [Flavobacteriales bacterium]